MQAFNAHFRVILSIYDSFGPIFSAAEIPLVLIFLFFFHVYQSPQPFLIEFHQILALALSYDVKIYSSLKDDQSRSARLEGDWH